MDAHRRGSAAMTLVAVAICWLSLPFGLTMPALAGADPAFSFYGYQEIVPVPNPAIVDENTHISVTVSNLGDTVATNVQVRLSYNDWGVTFQGWQEIGTVTIASIGAGGSALAEFDYVFENRAHTCLEALIVSADQNDNPNNDRGQINLEVYNAGETFEYYVPIVNNGEDDLLVQVLGRCVHGNPGEEDFAAAADGQDGEFPDRCRPIDVELVVPAGEEVLVPIQVEFLPETEPGTEIEFEVLALDVTNPNDARANNHARIRVVYNTARRLLEDCLLALDTLPPLPDPGKGKAKGLEKRLDDIAKHLDKALDSEQWVDDFRLQPRKDAAQKVYEQVAVAVGHMENLIASKDVPLDWKIELNRCADDLTDAARILLQTAIRDAGGDAKAESSMQEGDELRRAGNGDKAVREYRKGHVTVLK